MSDLLVLAVVVGVVGAVGIGAVLWRLRRLGDDSGLTEQLRAAEARLHEAETNAALARQEAARLPEALDAVRILTQRGEAMAEAKGKVEARLAEVEARLAEREQSHAEQLAHERKIGAEKLATLQEAREDLTRQFKVLAAEVMQRQGEDLSKSNKERLDALLNPLKDRIEGFHKRVNDIYSEETRERASLVEQIRSLTELNTRMSTDANNLTRALKGQSQTQGAWGEMILESLLENSGLRAGEEYEVQASHTDDDNRRLRPDVIVRLPGGRSVVIDSKVSLTAYEEYCSAEDDATRDLALKKHVGSLKAHIAGLARKDYASVVGGSLDYVLMFIPIEGAFSAAVMADRELAQYALTNHIGLTTPTTLLTVLRTISHLWQVERRNVNAQKIAEEAGKMYDKFVGFTDDLRKIGSALDQAQKAHGAALSKFTDGPGNVVRKLEQLKAMGIATKKDVHDSLLDAAGVDDDDDDRDDAADRPVSGALSAVD